MHLNKQISKTIGGIYIKLERVIQHFFLLFRSMLVSFADLRRFELESRVWRGVSGDVDGDLPRSDVASACPPRCLLVEGVIEPVGVSLPDFSIAFNVQLTSPTRCSHSCCDASRTTLSETLSRECRHQKRERITRKRPFQPDLASSNQDVGGSGTVGRC